MTAVFTKCFDLFRAGIDSNNFSIFIKAIVNVSTISSLQQGIHYDNYYYDDCHDQYWNNQTSDTDLIIVLK